MASGPCDLKLIIRSQDGSADAAAEFDDAIAKLNAEIDRMAPNMKAMERWVVSYTLKLYITYS